METVLDILKGLHPDIDFMDYNTLIDDGVLDSFDIVTLVAELGDRFDISISPLDIVPENFNSAQAIYQMVARLTEE